MKLKEILTKTTDEFIGRRLELFRSVLGKRRAEIADELGWSPEKWDRWENGMETPPVPAMIALAERYDGTLDYIYRGDMSRLPEWMARGIRERINSSHSRISNPVWRNDRVRLLARWETDENYRFTTNSCLFGVLRDDQGHGLLYPYSPIGRTRWELSDGDPDIPFWAAHIADLDARKPFRNFRYPMVTRAGRHAWAITSGYPRYEDGGFTGYAGTVLFVASDSAAQSAA